MRLGRLFPESICSIEAFSNNEKSNLTSIVSSVDRNPSDLSVCSFFAMRCAVYRTDASSLNMMRPVFRALPS